MRFFCIAGVVTLALLAPAGQADAQADPPERLWLAQGLGINDLLKGAPDTGPAERQDTPVLPRSTPDVSGILLGAPAPDLREAVPDSGLPAAQPAWPFDRSALSGTWLGKGEICAGRQVVFAGKGDGFSGQATQVDAADGYRITTTFDVTADSPLQGAPFPGAQGAYFSFARQYDATLTRTGPDGAVLDLVEDWPVTLLVARDVDTGGFALRFAEPVSVCGFVRSDD